MGCISNSYCDVRYDGNPFVGYRLYREVIKCDTKMKGKQKGSTSLPILSTQWETMAINLEEFHKVKVCWQSLSLWIRVLLIGLRNLNDFILVNGRTHFYAVKSPVKLLLERKLNLMPFPFLRNFRRLLLLNFYGFEFKCHAFALSIC